MTILMIKKIFIFIFNPSNQIEH